MDTGRIDLDRARREAKRRVRAARERGHELKLSDAQPPWRASSAPRAGRGSCDMSRRTRWRVPTARDGSWRRRRTDGATTRRRCSRSTPSSGARASTPRSCSARPSGCARRWTRDPGLVDAPVRRARLAAAALPLPLRVPRRRRTGGLVDCAQALLEAGADPDSSWQHPEFGALGALYGAAGVAHEPRMTALLLEAGANPDDDESVYHATETADDTCLRLLLDAGAKVEGTNAIAHCLDTERPAMLRLLLDHEPGHEVPRSLLWAIYRGRSPEVLRMLVDAGADVNAWTRRTSARPTGSPGGWGGPTSASCSPSSARGARSARSTS